MEIDQRIVTYLTKQEINALRIMAFRYNVGPAAAIRAVLVDALVEEGFDLQLSRQARRAQGREGSEVSGDSAA